MLMLFIRMTSLELFLYKILISIIMTLVTFNYKNIRYTLKNLYYIYIISIIIGGFLTFINNSLSNYNEGLIFINNNVKINLFVSILISIILIINYIRQTSNLKKENNKFYKVKIYSGNELITLNAFLDTGNKLIDPYKRRPIILVNEEKIESFDCIYVPYNTISSSGIIRCVRADKIYIDGIGYKRKFLIGLTDKISMDGVDCILNERLLEG